MDREGFRNRLKQYKEARGQNPQLKYWEWKAQPAENGIPKYVGGGIVGIPSTTTADGMTKHIYYDPYTDLKYQNIHLPEVVVTASKNTGKRLPMRMPDGSYERFKFLGDVGKEIGGFLPVAGEVIDTYDLTTDVKNKNWANTAIRVGSYFIPNIVEKGVNLIKTGIKGLRKYPTIDVNTAHEITNKQWDRAYNQALQANDETELQRLRDLHFSAKSNTVVKDKNGMPIETYHTVGDSYNPNFTKFNPTIEGTRSAIYTTDDKIMSGSYSTSYTSEEELEKLHEFFVEKGFSDSMDKTYETVQKQGLWEPQRQKKLYISLHNPAEIDADSRNWNRIEKSKLPEKLWDLSFKIPFLRNADNVTTRDIENLYRRAKDYDGAIIKNVRDYSVGKFLSNDFLPHTVFEVENPANLKLSDAVTYNDVGKVIPLSKRDNFNNRDIRYSLVPIGLAGLAGLEYNIENEKSNSYAEGGEIIGPPIYEEWLKDINKYNPTIWDGYSMQVSLDEAQKVFGPAMQQLPGYDEIRARLYPSMIKPEPNIADFVEDTWENENPNNLGLKKGKYYPHKSPEGGSPTIGPGFKIGSGSHNITAKEAKQGVTKHRLDKELENVGKENLAAVNKFINNGQTTNPADTVSPQIKQGLMDLRYQVGPLGGWKELQKAVLEGDIDKIQEEAKVKWKDKGVMREDARRNDLRNKKYFHYRDGGEVTDSQIEVLPKEQWPSPEEMYKRTKLPFNDLPLENVFSPLDIALGTAYKAWPIVNSVFKNYGPTLGALAVGSDGTNMNKPQQQMLTKKLDPDVKEFYNDIVIPLNPNDKKYKQYFINQFGDIDIQIDPASNMPINFAADFNPVTDNIRLNTNYIQTPMQQQLEAHEYGHLVDKYLPHKASTQQELNQSLPVSKKPISKDSDTYRERQSTKREAEFKTFKKLKDAGKLQLKTARAKTKKYQEYLTNATDEEILELLGADTAYKKDYLAGNLDIDTLRKQMIYAPTIAAGIIVPTHLLDSDKKENA